MLPPLPFPKADRVEVTTVANNMIRLDQYGEVFTAATGNSSAGLGRVSTIVTREEAMNLSKKLCALALGALLLVSGTVAAREGAEHVATVVSLSPVTNTDAWVESITPVAGEWTRENGAEVCGVIAQSPDGRLGIVLAAPARRTTADSVTRMCRPASPRPARRSTRILRRAAARQS